MAIVINTNRRTSEKDTDDLKMLLEDIRERFNFNWHIASDIEINELINKNLALERQSQELIKFIQKKDLENEFEEFNQRDMPKKQTGGRNYSHN